MKVRGLFCTVFLASVFASITRTDISYTDTWANCSSYTGEILMKLGEYLEEIDSPKK